MALDKDGKDIKPTKSPQDLVDELSGHRPFVLDHVDQYQEHLRQQSESLANFEEIKKKRSEKKD